MIGAPNDQGVDRWVAQLKDHDWVKRQKAILELGDLGDPAVTHLLIPFLKNRHWEIRRQAAESLGKLQDIQALDPLIAAMRDRDEVVRDSAADALGLFGEARAVDALVQALRAGKPNVEKAFRHPRALEPLKEIATGSENLKTRARALVAVGQLQSNLIIPVLLNALKDSNAYLRAVGVDAIREILHDSTSALVIHSEIVHKIHLSESRIPDRTPDAATKEVLDRHTRATELRVQLALDRIRSVAIADGLMAALDDSSAVVKKLAAEGLQEAIRARGVAAMEEQYPGMVEHVVWTMKSPSLDATSLANEIRDPRSINRFTKDALIAVALSNLIPAYKTAINALGQMNDLSVVDTLLRACGSDYKMYETVRVLAAMKAPGLVQELSSRVEPERHESKKCSARVLGEIANAGSTKALMAALERNDIEVVEAAAAFFIKMGDSRAIPLLTQVLAASSDRGFAGLLLNSGNSELEAAATAWASARHLRIETRPGGATARWGRR